MKVRRRAGKVKKSHESYSWKSCKQVWDDVIVASLAMDTRQLQDKYIIFFHFFHFFSFLFQWRVQDRTEAQLSSLEFTAGNQVTFTSPEMDGHEGPDQHSFLVFNIL